ncbi:uncharacterized protein HMPREF1541_07486 [Cyphellophora europaea CBS 101466]|uniref:FAD-binding domain-containing protein n=1 Tax=Cyphellophora europaea (strain CBS 101466) TaxID=1220924 RepID=W2RQ98_CYPE1|nr:uncharacterized protein HMPREF1541_07486 [Cyphellophora europaea CBS 101466]ETN37863.1 hypothetical protein HMPREF1541_07486 [Cyphellophora europaea CBS 101466]
MPKLEVLVVGASVAGPMTAYWLARAGARVTIIERFPVLRTNGQAIDIRTSGVTVMRKIPGMEAAVRAKTTQLEGLSYVREDGRPYGVIRATGNPDQQSLISEYEIFRGDLSQILFDLTKNNENIRYIFNEQVVSIQQRENQNGSVTVEFANGTATSSFDLIVACDGAASRIRALGFNCAVRDHVETTGCWATYFSVKEDFLQGSKTGQAHSATGGRFVSIEPDPSGINQVTLMKLSARDTPEATLGFRQALKQGDDALKQFVAQQYQDVGWRTADLLKGMMETDDFYGSELVQVHIPALFSGRVVLVGDAGFAPGFSGMGTSLAMTGAYVLAGEIQHHKGDVGAGLEGYEKRMRPMINEMSKVPPFVTTLMSPQTRWGIWLRNAVFAVISWTNVVEYLQRFSDLFGAAFASNDECKLPDYEWEK